MPRPSTPMAHPNMYAATGRFSRLANVERATRTVSDFGDVVEAWSTRYGDLPAVVSTVSGGGEVRRADDSIVADPYVVLLAGAFPDVSPRDRLTVDGVAYGIVRAQVDSQSNITRLTCEVVT